MTPDTKATELPDTTLDEATAGAMSSPADQLSWRGFNPQPEPPAINMNFLSMF